jgi:acetyl esterase/lipase
MDQIKALHGSKGDSIFAVLSPTFQIFATLLSNNREEILSIPSKTESYGTHPRQNLDIYYPPKKSDDAPILVFFYGGGLVGGDKILPGSGALEGLVYHNLGTFFAKRGITTIIADYRLVNSELGGHDAVFPSGGEDVSLVLKWLETFTGKGKGDVFIMGNSAGGVHISTFLLAPRFLEQRKSLLNGEKGITLKGAIELAVPFHFHNSPALRGGMLKNYYGSDQDVRENSPFGLLEAVAKTGKSRDESGVPKILVLDADFDPVDEILEPTLDFVKLSKELWGTAVEYVKIPGHNHISPPLALMSGDEEGEKWSEAVELWIQHTSI